MAYTWKGIIRDFFELGKLRHYILTAILLLFSFLELIGSGKPLGPSIMMVILLFPFMYVASIFIGMFTFDFIIAMISESDDPFADKDPKQLIAKGKVMRKTKSGGDEKTGSSMPKSALTDDTYTVADHQSPAPNDPSKRVPAGTRYGKATKEVKKPKGRRAMGKAIFIGSILYSAYRLASHNSPTEYYLIEIDSIMKSDHSSSNVKFPNPAMIPVKEYPHLEIGDEAKVVFSSHSTLYDENDVEEIKT